MINNKTIQPIFEYSNLIRMTSKSNNVKSSYLFKSGRHSLFYALSRIKSVYKKNYIILLPQLICNEIIPIIEYFNIKIKYYKVLDNLQPDYESIKVNINQDNSILLVVNYFGFPSNWSEINKIKKEFKITGALVQVGEIKIDYDNWNEDFIEKNDFFSPDEKIIEKWEKLILKARKEGSSLGAIIEVRCKGMPVGLGEPVYDKLDADLAKSMMSINAVKGVEIGNGFNSVYESGVSNVDEMRIKNNKPFFLSNNNGGILGGISTGQDIIVRFCVKPTSSILTKRKTIDVNYKEKEISTKGRHDPCVGIRAVPVGEAMMATTLADHCLRYL